MVVIFTSIPMLYLMPQMHKVKLFILNLVPYSMLN